MLTDDALDHRVGSYEGRMRCERDDAALPAPVPRAMERGQRPVKGVAASSHVARH
jgi:hypothetical protein